MTIRKNTPLVARNLSKPTFTVELFCTPSEGVAFPRHFPTPSEGVGNAHHRYGYPENYFDEFTSGCTLFFNRLKISDLQILLHIRPVAKESECAARFVTIWFTRGVFFHVHHEVNSLKAGFNVLPTNCLNSRYSRSAAFLSALIGTITGSAEYGHFLWQGVFLRIAILWEYDRCAYAGDSLYNHAF